MTTDVHFEELDEFYNRALDGELDEGSLQALTETSVYKIITESIAVQNVEAMDYLYELYSSDEDIHIR